MGILEVTDDDRSIWSGDVHNMTRVSPNTANNALPAPQKFKNVFFSEV